MLSFSRGAAREVFAGIASLAISSDMRVPRPERGKVVFSCFQVAAFVAGDINASSSELPMAPMFPARAPVASPVLAGRGRLAALLVCGISFDRVRDLTL